MAEPSPKRRKTSPVTMSTIETASKPRAPAKSKPAWSSYLSPTKASLAHLYPHLSAAKSTVPRNRSPLRQAAANHRKRELLRRQENGLVDRNKGTNTLFDQSGDPATALGKRVARDPKSEPTNRVTAYPMRNATRFAIANNELPKGPRASPPGAAEVASSSSPRGESNSSSPDEGHSSEPNGTRTADVIKTPSKHSRHSPEYTDDGEPRLPSTPVQLGLEPPPQPPSGLSLSSSSRKYRSRLTSVPTSSPLKPRSADLTSSTPRSRSAIAIFEDTCRGVARIPPVSEMHGARVCFVNIPSPDRSLIVTLRLHYDDEGTQIDRVSLSWISDWAAAELGSCLKDLAAQKDLPEMRYVVERYWVLSEERARCWAECERDLGELMPSGRASHELDTEEHDPLQGLTGDAMHRWRGRQHLMVHHDGSTLLIQWEVVPDPDGGLRKKFSTSMSFDKSTFELAEETYQASEAFRALTENGKDYPEAIKMLVQAVFTDNGAERWHV